MFAGMGYWFLGLVPASAILLGAVIAPTDPVLAAEIQTTAPNQEDHSKTRLALTTEAGLNDGLAFPFTNMAVAMVLVGNAPADWFASWFLVDVIYKILVGAGIGYFAGWIMGKATFNFLVKKGKITSINTGVLALSLTFLPYGLAELAGSYGFIAVFLAACKFRSSLRTDSYI